MMPNLLHLATATFRQHRRLFRDPWSRSQRGQGIRIAILDTGVEMRLLPPQARRRIERQIDFVGDPIGIPKPLDGTRKNEHGTCAAAIIAATAPACSLVDCRVVEGVRVQPEALAAGIIWAAEEGGARVISISAGTSQMAFSGLLKAACSRAIKQGAVVVAACPNVDTPSLPSAFDEVIAVKGLDLGRQGRLCLSRVIPNLVFAHNGPYRAPLVSGARVDNPMRGNSAAGAAVSGYIARVLGLRRDNAKPVMSLLADVASTII